MTTMMTCFESDNVSSNSKGVAAVFMRSVGFADKLAEMVAWDDKKRKESAGSKWLTTRALVLESLSIVRLTEFTQNDNQQIGSCRR
jgi:hypothetical protein